MYILQSARSYNYKLYSGTLMAMAAMHLNVYPDLIRV